MVLVLFKIALMLGLGYGLLRICFRVGLALAPAILMLILLAALAHYAHTVVSP